MIAKSRTETTILFAGDITAFLAALWLTLAARNLALPGWETFLDHFFPFSIIFAVWLLVFFISDLYRRQNSFFRKKLPSVLLNAQLINSVIAIIFFYFIPYFGITPKITLFIDLFFSFALIFAWRNFLCTRFNRGRKEKVIFLSHGKETDEVVDELKSNPNYNVATVEEDSIEDLKRPGSAIVVVNTYDNSLDGVLPDYYRLFIGGTRFVGVHTLYEELFDRIPIESINEKWFLENISNNSKPYYNFLKRMIDLVLSFVFGLLSLVFYPLVWVAIKLDDRGPIFIAQDRVGQNGKLVRIYKFRSMSGNDNGKYGAGGTSPFNVTRVGKFLRATRIDELPQFWNVLRGDISLIGPRLELPSLVKRYEEEIPYFSIRLLIKPGLSGWAQIYGEHAHLEAGVSQTKNKLSYDLYYLKNRSLWLDIKIVLKTVKTLLSRSGA